MRSAFSNLSRGARLRSRPSSLVTFTRVACSFTTEPTERSMKSPPLLMLNMMDGMDR